jgi:hypothetical protein
MASLLRTGTTGAGGANQGASSEIEFVADRSVAPGPGLKYSANICGVTSSTFLAGTEPVLKFVRTIQSHGGRI